MTQAEEGQLDPAMDRVEISLALGQCLAGLPEKEREIILLRHVGDFTVEQVADQMSISLSAAQMRLSRAMEKLRKKMAGRGYEASGSVLASLLRAPSIPSSAAGLPAEPSALAVHLAQSAAWALTAAAVGKSLLWTGGAALLIVSGGWAASHFTRPEAKPATLLGDPVQAKRFQDLFAGSYQGTSLKGGNDEKEDCLMEVTPGRGGTESRVLIQYRQSRETTLHALVIDRSGTRGAINGEPVQVAWGDRSLVATGAERVDARWPVGGKDVITPRPGGRDPIWRTIPFKITISKTANGLTVLKESLRPEAMVERLEMSGTRE
jgi:hypothetical protein